MYVMRDDDAQEREQEAYMDLRGALLLVPAGSDVAAVRQHSGFDRWETFADEVSLLRGFGNLPAQPPSPFPPIACTDPPSLTHSAIGGDL